MTLEQLINQFRLMANDRIAPYFWSDADITHFLNEAEREAALRARLLLSETRIPVTAGAAIYSIGKMFELEKPAFVSEGKTTALQLASQSFINEAYPDWTQKKGAPVYAMVANGWLRLFPEPMTDGEVVAHGYSMPENELAAPADTPEIREQYHGELVSWALYRAFSIPDSETFDPSKSALGLREFEIVFGLKPSANIRQSARENLPQTNKVFWP